VLAVGFFICTESRLSERVYILRASGFQLLINATTGHVGESKQFSVRKNGAGDEDRTGAVQTEPPRRHTADQLDQLKTNRDWKTEFVHLVIGTGY